MGIPEHTKTDQVFSGRPYGIVTAENPVAPSLPGGNKALEQRFKKEGLHYEPVAGNYGHDENSYIVHDPTLDQMHSIGKDFGQESVIYGSGGEHQLHYTTGPHAGTFHAAHPEQPLNYFPQKPDKYWTQMPGGKGYFNVNLDWNTKHPRGKMIMKNYDLAKAIQASMAKQLKKDLPMAPLTKPALHSTVEGFMGGLKTLPKGSPARGKFITQHMNHGPFLSALSAHPQGKQVHAMLTTHLNSQANAGFKPGGAVAAVKAEGDMAKPVSKIKAKREAEKARWAAEDEAKAAHAKQHGTKPSGAEAMTRPIQPSDHQVEGRHLPSITPNYRPRFKKSFDDIFERISKAWPKDEADNQLNVAHHLVLTDHALEQGKPMKANPKQMEKLADKVRRPVPAQDEMNNIRVNQTERENYGKRLAINRQANPDFDPYDAQNADEAFGGRNPEAPYNDPTWRSGEVEPDPTNRQQTDDFWADTSLDAGIEPTSVKGKGGPAEKKALKQREAKKNVFPAGNFDHIFAHLTGIKPT